MPVAQDTDGGKFPVTSNHELVGSPFHATILLGGETNCKMARTIKGRERFAFRITIVPPDQPKPRPPWIGTHRWKYRAVYIIKMKLTLQIEKASLKARRKWNTHYSVRGYGAPGRLEFICPYSGMVAKTVQQEEAVSVRRYWVNCAAKSKEILEWINQLDPERYSRRLHTYLLRTIVTTYGMRELEAYERRNPFQKPKPWQKL